GWISKGGSIGAMPKKARPIPKGYHTLTIGVTVKDAAGLITFCKKAFGAKEIARVPGPGGTVMHADLLIGDSHFMLGDENPMMKSASALGGTPVTFHIYTENCDAMFKKAVSAGATVVMPLADQFWGDRYGRVLDPFGNMWSVGTHVEDVSPQE